MVQRTAQGGWTATAVADALGVSPRTVYKWRARYRTGGMAALEEGSLRRRLPLWVDSHWQTAPGSGVVMRKSKSNESQIVGILKEADAGVPQPVL